MMAISPLVYTKNTIRTRRANNNKVFDKKFIPKKPNNKTKISLKMNMKTRNIKRTRVRNNKRRNKNTTRNKNNATPTPKGTQPPTTVGTTDPKEETGKPRPKNSRVMRRKPPRSKLNSRDSRTIAKGLMKG